MHAFYSFVAGLVFGIGMIVCEWFSPVKVLAFLDPAGNWDPSLALVVACAIAVGAIAFALARRRTTTLIGTPMHLPHPREIDVRLVLGSLAFGIGWGLAGLDPGSSLVAAGTGHVKAFIFVVAMIAGMGIHEFAEKKRAQRTAEALPQAHAHHPRAHEHARPKHRARKGH